MCILLLYFKQGKSFCFPTDNLVNLRRIRSASPSKYGYVQHFGQYKMQIADRS